ncbi:MAG: type III secretion system inner membrane ring lipoprotein SctJ [Janthinobacterium lividum]
MRTDRRDTLQLIKHFLRALACTMLINFMLAGCGASADLLTDIPESEANEVLSALLEANIRAKKVAGKEGAVSLQVEQAQMARAISTLEAEGLPRDRYVRMGDVFRKEGLISSPLEERARYLWALSQELSATIAFIDGVVKARVHVVLPERSSGSDPAMPSSAAVFIKYRHGYNIDDSIPQIKRLVANSIPGLSAEKVSVVLLQAMPKPAGDGSRAGPVATASQPDSGMAGPLPLYGWLAIGLTVLAASGLVGWRIAGKRRTAGYGTTGGPGNGGIDETNGNGGAGNGNGGGGAGLAGRTLGGLFRRKNRMTPVEPS